MSNNIDTSGSASINTNNINNTVIDYRLSQQRHIDSLTREYQQLYDSYNLKQNTLNDIDASIKHIQLYTDQQTELYNNKIEYIKDNVIQLNNNDNHTTLVNNELQLKKLNNIKLLNNQVHQIRASITASKQRLNDLSSVIDDKHNIHNELHNIDIEYNNVCTQHSENMLELERVHLLSIYNQKQNNIEQLKNMKYDIQYSVEHDLTHKTYSIIEQYNTYKQRLHNTSKHTEQVYNKYISVKQFNTQYKHEYELSKLHFDKTSELLQHNKSILNNIIKNNSDNDQRIHNTHAG